MSDAPPPSSPADPGPAAELPAVPTLPVLVLLGFAVRLGAWLLKALVGTDAYQYVRIARMIAAGDWRHAIEHGYHPAYPALGALAGAPFGSAPGGLIAVSLALGALTAVPAWQIGRRLAGPRGAFFAALLAAVHPGLVDVGSDILVEATFVFFLVSAVALALRASEGFSLRCAAAAGVAAGAAFLTRPEGLVLPAVAAPFLLLAPAALPRFAPRRWIAATVLGLAFLAAALPYTVALRAVYGRWILTPKSGGAAFGAGAEKQKAGESQKKVQEAAKRNALHIPWTFVRKFTDALYLPLALLVLAASFVRGPPTDTARGTRLFLAALLALYLPPLLRLLWNQSYISTRHLLAPAVLLLLGTAPAVCATVARDRRFLRVAVLVLAAATLPKTLRPQRREEIGLKQAGLWLRANAPGEPVAGAEKVAYYADVVQFKVPGDPAEVAPHLEDVRVRWLALVEDDMPGLAGRLGPEFVPVCVFGEGDDRVTVIRFDGGMVERK